MDILDRLLGHDAATTRELLLLCDGLSDAQLDHDFEFGQGTLRRTLEHIVGNIETWTALITGGSDFAKPGGENPVPLTTLLERFDAIAPRFAMVARMSRDQDRLDDTFVDVLEAVPRRKTVGGAILHLATHGMHHRAQLLIMLELLGIRHDIESDALGWERRLRGGWESAA